MGHTVMLVTLVAFVVVVLNVKADVKVMKDVTLGFGEALDICREESGLTEEKMEEFFHFWSDDFKFELREFGCAILCMSNHYNLLTATSRMHHENTDQFIKSFPNGEVLSKLMIEMVHTCEKANDSEPDHCVRILQVAECFKEACKERGIAPSIEMMMAEFIMEADG